MVRPTCILALLIFSFSVVSGVEKVYLPKDKVVIHNNQILIGEGGNWKPISQLSSDDRGLYVESTEAANILEWECENCGNANWFWDDYCLFCGYDR